MIKSGWDDTVKVLYRDSIGPFTIQLEDVSSACLQFSSSFLSLTMEPNEQLFDILQQNMNNIRNQIISDEFV